MRRVPVLRKGDRVLKMPRIALAHPMPDQYFHRVLEEFPVSGEGG